MAPIRFSVDWAGTGAANLAPVSCDLINNVSPVSIIMREDDAFRISLHGARLHRGDCRVFLCDIPIDLHDEVDGFITIKSQMKRHLEHYFGRCPVRIEFPRTGEVFCPIEFNVLAKKVTAEQAKEIILYLTQRESDILRFCFSRVGSESNMGESGIDDPSIILQKAEQLLNYVAKNRGYLQQHKHNRLVPRQKFSAREDSRRIDDSSITWLFSNLDQLTASDDLDYDVLLRGRKFRIGSILNQSLVSDTDIYENRVIYSLLHSISTRLSNYLSEAQVVTFRKDALSGYDNYFSLESVLSDMLPICGIWQARCRQLILQSKLLMAFMDRAIPCRLETGLRPTITPFVRSNTVYRDIFFMANDWYKSGSPTWQGQDFLASLLSLPKLYEFYCLYMLLDNLTVAGFAVEATEYREFVRGESWKGQAAPRPNRQPNNYWRCRRGSSMLEFFYEPTIRAFSGFHEDRALVDIKHVSAGHARGYFSPDFLIRIEHPDTGHSYMIFDAKFSNENTVISLSIPSIVNKYMHGIAEVDKERRCLMRTPLIAILALFPRANGVTTRYVNPEWVDSRFGLFGTPVYPAVAAVEVSPSTPSMMPDILEILLKFSGANSQ